MHVQVWLRFKPASSRPIVLLMLIHSSICSAMSDLSIDWMELAWRSDPTHPIHPAYQPVKSISRVDIQADGHVQVLPVLR